MTSSVEWLREILHRSIAGVRNHRGWDEIHGSELTRGDYCPREAALAHATGARRRSEFVPTSLRVTFDYGRDLQWRINNDWLGQMMVGNWACRGCGARKELSLRPPPEAGACYMGCRFEYEEFRANDPHTGASVGLDGMLVVARGDGQKLRILECKTEVKDEFKALVAPRSEHTDRANLYLEVALRDQRIRDYVDPTGVTLLYVCKGYGVKDQRLHQTLKAAGVSDYPYSPFKTFEVARNQRNASQYLSMARAVTMARAGQGWPCGVCVRKTDKRAATCCVKETCFSGRVPFDVTWTRGGNPLHPGKTVADPTREVPR